MFRRLIVSVCASVCVSACGPEWDTEVEGFVSVSSSMPPPNVDAPVWIHTFITLRNGDELVRLFFDEKTQLLNTGEDGRISWDFDRVHRSEHQARIDSLRAIADNVQERIREIEATQARAAGTHVSEEDQVRLDFAEGELENLRTYLEEIQSRIDAIESRDDRTE